MHGAERVKKFLNLVWKMQNFAEHEESSLILSYWPWFPLAFLKISFFLLIFQVEQSRIQHPVKHLWWSFLTVFAKSPTLDFWLSSETPLTNPALFKNDTI